MSSLVPVSLPRPRRLPVGHVKGLGLIGKLMATLIDPTYRDDQGTLRYFLYSGQTDEGRDDVDSEQRSFTEF